jgi:O-antigen ligase
MVLALIILAVVLVLMIKGWSDPFLALMAFVVVYELQPGELFPALGDLHLERVLILYVFAVFLMKGIRLRYPSITRKLLWFFGVMLLSSLFAFWRSNSFLFDFKFLEIVIYHLLLVAALTSEDRIRKYVILYTAMITWIAVTSLYNYHHGVRVFTMHIERAEGLTSAGGDPDTMAQTLVITMPLVLALLAKGTSKWLKLYAAAAFAVMLLTVIDTGSRTAILAFVVFLTLTLFQKPKNLKFLPLVLVAIPLMWIALPQQYKARYETIKTRDEDDSYTNRLLSWQGGVKMFLHSPITGIGPDDYTDANGMEYWPGTPRHWLNAHSLYFKLLGELGILGVFTFLALLISVMRTNLELARRYRKKLMDPILRRFPTACNHSFILMLFSGYAAHNTYRSNWYTLAAVTAALALVKSSENVAKSDSPLPAPRLPAWVPAKPKVENEVVSAV